MLGSRSPEKLTDWLAAEGQGARAGTFAETAAFGDIVVLAVNGQVAKNALDLAGADHLAGKTVIDATNPIAEGGPQNGVLPYFTDINRSLMEELQAACPEAHFVKAFSCVGNALMVDPPFDQKPTMFICGNSAGAKKEVESVLDQFGWETADMGGVEGARAIEPLAMLWLIPAFREGRWTHAFKLLQK